MDCNSAIAAVDGDVAMMRFALRALGLLLVAETALVATVIAVTQLPRFGVEPWFGVVVGLGAGWGVGWLGDVLLAHHESEL
jgi:hypothetical protein